MPRFLSNTLLFLRGGRLFLLGILALTATVSLRAEQNEVVVVSPHWDGIREETSRAFSAWHQKNYGQPATIRWRDAGGGSQIVRFLGAEYRTSPTSGIDVVYGGGVDPYRDLEKAGLLSRYDPPGDILAQIPPQLNGMDLIDPGHEWFAASLAGFGIITNEKARQAVGLPEVRTWGDLADPRLAGWIAACDPRASSSTMAIYEIILQAYGWEKGWALLMAMSGNVRNFTASAPVAATEVGIGDAAYGVSIDMYGNAQAAYYGSDNVSFRLPEGQTVMTPDCIAILKNPPHPELARHLIDFVLSRDNQLLSLLPKGAPGGARRNIINRMSVWPSLYDEVKGTTPITTNPFTSRFDFVYSTQLASQRRGILSVLIAAWMIDTHDVLTRAWKALHSPAAEKLPTGRQEALLADFAAPPCSDAELLRLAESDWKDPVKRTALVNRWQREALDRYEKLLRELANR